MKGGQNAMWQTIQEAISSNAKTARFLAIIAGLLVLAVLALVLAVLACQALGPAGTEVLRTVIAVMRTGA